MHRCQWPLRQSLFVKGFKEFTAKQRHLVFSPNQAINCHLITSETDAAKTVLRQPTTALGQKENLVVHWHHKS
ncbi:hypothetical protein PMIT1318_00847 [Prochlorococcus marinus str. MIT 1318]|nr:hypothetical protein PMIT1318_00847 [Prochlorococcus marinus str. MIT 1318]